jgi:hypothetical protein
MKYERPPLTTQQADRLARSVHKLLDSIANSSNLELSVRFIRFNRGLRVAVSFETKKQEVANE